MLQWLKVKDPPPLKGTSDIRAINMEDFKYAHERVRLIYLCLFLYHNRSWAQRSKTVVIGAESGVRECLIRVCEHDTASTME